MERIWLKHYSAGVPADIDPGRYANLIELIETAFKTHAAKPAYKMMGATHTLAPVDEASRALADPTCRGWGWPKATASPPS